MSDTDRKSWLTQIESALMQAGVSYVERVAQLEQALATMSAQLTDANRTIAQLTLGTSWLGMSDPPQSDPDAPPRGGVVDAAIEALDKRLVGRSDRVRLRGALDKADAPLTGRAGADEALGRIARLARR